MDKMTGKMHLWVNEPVEQDGMTTAGITIEGFLTKDFRLWYRFPEKYRPALTNGADPFVLAMIFSAMLSGKDMHVHGQVSPSLLRNLDEFQSAWVSWRPYQYTKIEITADSVHEQQNAGTDSAISAFSGGVDSAFTALCHTKGKHGGGNRNLKACLMVHGFDIDLFRLEVFQRSFEKSKRMLDSIGMDLIAVTTNFQDMRNPWWDAHGAALASALMLFQGGFTAGIVPSTEPYDGLVLPWGSNPVTDWMMSSETFAIVHYGASFSRTGKIRELSEWPEALRDLRVCMVGKDQDRNCNVCEKCVRTILNFRVLGLPLPGCFDRDVSDFRIMRLSGLTATQEAELRRILFFAKKKAIKATWVRALQICLFKNRQHSRLNTLIRGLKRIPRKHK